VTGTVVALVVTLVFAAVYVVAAYLRDRAERRHLL
jgi:hypothetical protein